MNQFSNNFKFLVVVLSFAFLVLSFLPAFAAGLMVKLPGYDETSPSLSGYLQWMFVFIVAVAGILALLMIMIGGFQYITAGGNESRAGNAKSRIKNAIIGLILALCSYLILNTINPDLVHPSLPGLIKLNPSDFKWEDYLPEPPKTGDAAHNIPDGGICATKLDCYYSRECRPAWFCPLDTAKTPYFDPVECNTVAKTGCGTDIQCEQKGICEAVKPDGTNLADGKTAKKSDGTFGVLYMNACDPPDKNPSVEQCYDEDAVCHIYYGNICYRKSTYGEPCKKSTDCENAYHNCDQGFCNTPTGERPPDIVHPPSTQFAIEQEGQGKSCKDTYYLIRKPVVLGQQIIKAKAPKSTCDGDLTEVMRAEFKNLCLIFPPPAQKSSKKTFFADMNATKYEENYLEIGWGYQHPTVDEKYGCKGAKSHGEDFEEVGTDWCKQVSTQLGESKEYDKTKCCMVSYACCTAPSNDDTCKAVLNDMKGFDEKIIHYTDFDNLKQELDIDVSNVEMEKIQRVACRVELNDIAEAECKSKPK